MVCNSTPWQTLPPNWQRSCICDSSGSRQSLLLTQVFQGNWAELVLASLDISPGSNGSGWDVRSWLGSAMLTDAKATLEPLRRGVHRKAQNSPFHVHLLAGSATIHVQDPLPWLPSLLPFKFPVFHPSLLSTSSLLSFFHNIWYTFKIHIQLC